MFYFILKKNKHFFKYLLLAISCVLSLSIIPIWITPAEAGITFKPPVTQAPQEDSSGGASRRKSCAADKFNSKDTSVVKVLPKSNIGLTTKKYPSIMVYVPATGARKAFFSIQDENFNYYYENTLQLPEKSGVMEINLPVSAPPLMTGANYQYSLAIMCGEELEPDSPVVSGWIQRIKTKDLKLNQEPSVELASKFASQGIWYDAVSILHKLRKSQPNNQFLINSWQELLNSADLNEVAQKAIVN